MNFKRCICQNAYAAFNELQKQGDFSDKTKLCQVKYLNNSIENDHKSIKRKSRYRQWYQSFETVKSTLDGIETMRMIQKGRVRKITKGDLRAQNKLIHNLFGLAA